jgi:hypothetical protein
MTSTALAQVHRWLAKWPPREMATLRELYTNPAAIDRLHGDAETIAELRALIADPAALARFDSMAEVIEGVRTAAAQRAEREAKLADQQIISAQDIAAFATFAALAKKLSSSL